MRIPHILSLLLAALSPSVQGATTVTTPQTIASGSRTYTEYSIILAASSASPMMWVYGGATVTINNTNTDKFEGAAVGLGIGARATRAPQKAPSLQQT